MSDKTTWWATVAMLALLYWSVYLYIEHLKSVAPPPLTIDSNGVLRKNGVPYCFKARPDKPKDGDNFIGWYVPCEERR